MAWYKNNLNKMAINFNKACISGCSPAQIINFDYAFSFEDIDKLNIYNSDNCKVNELEYAYSIDNICWSCYMNIDEMLKNTINIDSDFYIRIKISSSISKITFNDEIITYWKASLAPGFNFVSGQTASEINTNLYNPYANLDCAISLYQQLTESVSSMFGIPVYYFKLAPNAGSKDITFKEYTLMDVQSVKQIKIIVTDGQMPSSKPTFSEFGLDFETDWEVEVSKATFATAFGNNAQPMEGDIVWIPMMKRMWMVNEAYEEKKDAFMWNATTFKVALVKYQEKESVDLGDTETLVNSFVKNKYEDLFGENENVDAQSDAVDTPIYAADKLYSVYESDATRKYMSCDSIEYKEQSLYYKSTLISDLCYEFSMKDYTSIIYQSQYCGSSGTLSFIITPMLKNDIINKSKTIDDVLIECGNNITINIKQAYKSNPIIYVPIDDKLSLTLENNKTYFIYLRWSNELNIIELSAAEYVYPTDIPVYKLQSFHYYFDIDNIKTVVTKYNIEFVQEAKHDVILHGLIGTMTNIKLFNYYNDNISEILQMYPTSQHLIINDTARKIFDLNGVSLR